MWMDCDTCEDSSDMDWKGETMNLEDEIELLLAELDENQKEYDSLWNYINAHHPFTLSEWMKMPFRGEEE